MASYTDMNLQSISTGIIEYMLYRKNFYTGLDFTLVLKEVYFHVLVLTLVLSFKGLFTLTIYTGF